MVRRLLATSGQGPYRVSALSRTLSPELQTLIEAHPDRAEFVACDRQQRAIYDGPDAIEDEDEAAAATRPIFARMHDLLDRMEQLRALTSDGVAARARSLAQHSGDGAFSFDTRTTITGRLLGFLLRDAAAVGRA